MDRKEYLSKPLPSNADAEKSVLGLILIDNALITQAIGVISSDDFYSPIHRRIYGTMVTLFEQSKPIDPILIGEELKKDGSLESIGGIMAIMNLTQGLPYQSNLTEYAELIKEKSVARNFVKQASATIELVLAEELPILEVIGEHEQAVFNLKSNDKKKIVTVGSVAKVELARVVEFSKSDSTGNALLGLSTGFRDLNETLSGLVKTDVILVAGRPSMGKSALGLNLVANAVTDDTDAVCLLFPLEMSKEQVVNRMITQKAKVDSMRYRTGKLIRDEWEKVANAASWLNDHKIFIDDSAGVSPLHIKSKCMEILRQEKRLDLVLIDYVQLMSGGKKSESRQQEVSEISRTVKSMAKELNVPIILVSQLSRASELRADKRPILSDLRESGSLEQDCDIVLFIYRDEYYKKTEENSGIAEIAIAKNRNGATGKVKTAFLSECASFEEMYQR